MGAQKGYFNERTGESLALPIELWTRNRFHYSNITGFSKTWRPTRGGCIFWMPLLVIHDLDTANRKRRPIARAI